MTIKLDRPLVFFDLETTGVDPRVDRVIQVACVRLNPEGSREAFDSLVDPGVPIPREATAVHSITDDMVRGAPRFAELAGRLREFLAGADLGGFGVARFDVPMLTAEFARTGAPLDLSGRRIVDALTIFHRLEPRNLAAAHEFYCGKPMEKAHDARADVSAAVAVFLAQLERYADRPAPKLSLPRDIQALHDFCNATDPGKVDPRGRFIWRHGEATFNFGKHNGRTLADVVRSDRSYVEWLSTAEGSSPEVVDICRKALTGQFPRKTQPA